MITVSGSTVSKRLPKPGDPLEPHAPAPAPTAPAPTAPTPAAAPTPSYTPPSAPAEPPWNAGASGLKTTSTGLSALIPSAPAPAPAQTGIFQAPTAPFGNSLVLGSAPPAGTSTAMPAAGTTPAPHVSSGVSAPMPDPGTAPAPHLPAPAPLAPPTAQPGVFQGVPVGASFTPQEALAYVQTIVGRPLTPAEMQYAAQIAGYSGQGPLTGEQLNKIIAEAAKMLNGQYVEPATAAPAPAPGAPAAPPTDPFHDAITKQIEDLLGPTEYDPNAPEIRMQRDVHNVALQRAAERRRASAAERAAAQGTLDSGGFDVTADQIEADRGMGEAAFEADLATRELEGQRARLMQALQIGAGIMSQQQQLALQKELALIDQQLREKALALQDRLGTGELDLREYLGKGNLGLGLLQALLSDRQFADKLGLDYASLQRLLNRDSWDVLMGAF